jgi:Flp pilus assembly secretin CpaC
MIRKYPSLVSLTLLLSACASSEPKIIQATSDMPDVRVTVGMATQIEMPREGKVQSVAVGNPSLLAAEQASDVVSLIAKGGEGETNLIIRSRDEEGKIKVHQYRVIIQSK